MIDLTYDCLIIGGGVVGTAVLDALAKYELASILLEGGDDVSVGASRANSGIVHAGYDCEPNTLKAKFNVRGNTLMWKIANELNVPNKKCHSLVVAQKDQFSNLEELKKKGDMNGVNTRILDRKQTLEIEPNVSDDICYSLYAEDAGIISPYQLAIAYADRAILNGAKIELETMVKAISKSADAFEINTTKGKFYAKNIINCAGSNGAEINSLAGAECYKTEYRRGDYFVLDNTENKNIKTVIFPLPTEKGKGILVAPTADGNVIYGPTSVLTKNGDNATNLDAFEEIRKNVPLTYSKCAFNKCIRTYAGVRTIIGDDFVVKQSSKVENFYMAIGICSPGLSSSPAIAEYLEQEITAKLGAKLKDKYVINMEKKPRLTEMSASELNRLIAKDARWGKIVCRCEKVTEAEIVEAIHSPLQATTVDAVKRRTRAGMGRCQGGFCGARVVEILAKELNIPYTSVKKGAQGTEITRFAVKEVQND